MRDSRAHEAAKAAFFASLTDTARQATARRRRLRRLAAGGVRAMPRTAWARLAGRTRALKHAAGSSYRRHKGFLATTLAISIAITLCIPASVATADDVWQGTKWYKEKSGHWEILELPVEFRVNAIHGVLLPTGKVLLIAGSGNDTDQFEAGTFKTLLWDPAKGTGPEALKIILSPDDLFCGGHTLLADGELLVAGGTQRYEILAEDVTNAAGVMTVKNEDNTAAPRLFEEGTLFRAPSGKLYRSTADVTVPPAATTGRGASQVITASETSVWVEAVEPGEGSVTEAFAQYSIDGITGRAAQNTYGVAESLTLEKQEFQGVAFTYVFDPYAEQYVQVEDMKYERWYPTLATLSTGNVLAVSGLDGGGKILDGQIEEYDVARRGWVERPELTRYLPTYPWLTLMPDGDHLFYSGSNAGYGSETEGRTPGLWDLRDNTFQEISGLRDPTMTETSASVLLPPLRAAEDGRPAQVQAMILGGGGVGDSAVATARTDIVDLTDANPRYRPGPDLARPTRYPNAVILPDDTVLVTGGSSGYRGRGASDNHDARIFHPDTEAFVDVDTPAVGRDYHSGAILLPNGQVLAFGGNPLFSDKLNLTPAPFEQRLEVYSPPYLFQEDGRASLDGGPEQVRRGTTSVFTSAEPGEIARARLLRPGSATHVTDVDQRSIEMGVTAVDGGVELSIPAQAGLVPSGWYMLFVVDHQGVPSTGRWVQVL